MDLDVETKGCVSGSGQAPLPAEGQPLQLQKASHGLLKLKTDPVEAARLLFGSPIRLTSANFRRDAEQFRLRLDPRAPLLVR